MGRAYSMVSLFSGACGLDLGLERSRRFRMLAAVESEPSFCATIRANVAAGRIGEPGTLVHEGDIRALPPRDLMRRLGLRRGELDLLVGGPPCQSFSTAGRRRTVRDPRGELLWEFLRYVEVLQPKFFLMENVRGLLSAALRHRPIALRPEKGGPPLAPDERQGSVVNLWVDDLVAATGGRYRVDCFEVNAVNYGAPQLRERVLFFGNRLGAKVEFPAPTHGRAGSGLAPYTTLGSVLDGMAPRTRTLLDFSPRKKAYLRHVPPGGNWRAMPEHVQRESMGQAWFAKGGRSGWWRRLTRDLPCPTVVTMPNHAGTAMCHPDEVRVLSVEECAAIQGFPDDWVFCGTVQQQYTQVGNAVPVRLGEVAGEVLAATLARPRAHAAPAGSPAFRRVYLDSHVRTRQWFKRGEVFVWAPSAPAEELSA